MNDHVAFFPTTVFSALWSLSAGSLQKHIIALNQNEPKVLKE